MSSFAPSLSPRSSRLYIRELDGLFGLLLVFVVVGSYSVTFLIPLYTPLDIAAYGSSRTCPSLDGSYPTPRIFMLTGREPLEGYRDELAYSGSGNIPYAIR